MNPLLLPPKLLLRALDDLHLIAVAAHGLNSRLAGIEARADRIEDQIDTAIDAAVGIERRGEEAIAAISKILALGKRVDKRAEALLSVIENLDARAAQILRSASRSTTARPRCSPSASGGSSGPAR